MTIRGGGAPRGSMALRPQWRMDPPLRSFAADAHYCIMVWILWIRRIQVCGAMIRACWRASLRSSVDSMSLSTGHAEGGAERRNSMLDSDAPYKLPPRPAPLGAVLLDQPLARAVELQPRAVDQQVHGAGIAASAATRPVTARLRPRHLQHLGPAAQGGVVRHGEVEPE